MICECRGILRGNRDILNGEWNQNDIYNDTTNAALCNLRIGLYGYGGIGRAIAKRLIKGFGAEVVAYDEYCTPEQMMADGVKPVSLDELLSTSDIVSIHLRLVEATKNIIGKEAFCQDEADRDLLQHRARRSCRSAGSVRRASEQEDPRRRARCVLGRARAEGQPLPEDEQRHHDPRTAQV